MKYTKIALILIGIIGASLLGVQGDIALAQDTAPEEPVGNVVTFNTLGMEEEVLRGPFSTVTIAFGLPADWQLSPGAQLQLDLTTFISTLETLTEGAQPVFRLGASLEVEFNDILVDNVLLNIMGGNTHTINIPTNALEPTRRDGRHELTFFLDAGVDCDFLSQQTILSIHDTSSFVFPHTYKEPNVELVNLPRPIFQDTTFVEETATIVIPNQPTAAELRAALITAAGFGEMSGGDLLVSLTQADGFPGQGLDANHVIFVGKADDFPSLSSVALPAPVSGGTFDAPGANADDGIVQMAVSPWDNTKVVLVVGGNSDTGVVKASQALSTGEIRDTGQPNLSLVSAIQPKEVVSLTGTDRTLYELGYDDILVSDFGFSFVDFQFSIPHGQAIGSDAYLELVFTHSTFVEYNTSGIAVNLNGQPIGSVKFSEDTSGSGKVRIPLPESLVRAGTNNVSLGIDLIPVDACLDPRLVDLWVRIDSASLLHLPFSLAQTTQDVYSDLARYPNPFISSSLMENVAFVLAPNDLVGQSVAAQIAADLGNRSDISMANLEVVFGDSVSNELRLSDDLLIIGRPSALPIIGELSGNLPASFEPGSDLAIEENSQVVYRLMPGASVGYIELLSAPWDSNRIVLAVLGSTDEGLQWAGNALTTPALRGRLEGDFAVINGEQVVSTDTRAIVPASSALAAAAPEEVSETDMSVAPEVMPEIVERPGWILPALGGVIVAMLLIVLVAGISSTRRRNM